MRFIPHTPADLERMLAAIGAGSVAELLLRVVGDADRDGAVIFDANPLVLLRVLYVIRELHLRTLFSAPSARRSA